MYRVIVALTLILCLIPQATPSFAADCRFQLGFATLAGLLPQQVGACLDDEGHNPVNGDGLQHTVNGLLVWRKADNWTAFTDGYRTWINGPDGIQQRLNTMRFPWEANPEGLPQVPTGSSGIEGAVTFGPITPVCRIDIPCDRAQAASVTVRDATGRTVLVFNTDADGHFHVALAPGAYTLIPASLVPGTVFPRSIPSTVTVPANGYVTADLRYDTGIR